MAGKMGDISNQTFVGVAWIIHSAFFMAIASAFFYEAREKSGPILRWPVGLRWMFFVLFLTWGLICLGLVLIIFFPDLFGPINKNSVIAALLRYGPIPIEAWIFLRMRKHGLSLDKWERENGKH
jgi:hypothetical protein